MRSRSPKPVVLALLALLVFGAEPALAARIATPKLLSPASAAVVAALQPFAWAPVANADRYEFEVAGDAGFNSPVIGAGEDHFFTRNTRATLKKTIPNGTYWWRVRAVTKAGAVSAWSQPRSLQKAWTAAAALQAPAAGAPLAFPVDPLRLTWSPVPYAASYLVSLATDPVLGSLALSDPGSTGPIETAATTLTSPSVLGPGTYFWSVTPLDARGNKGTPSPVASFAWSWPSTTTPSVTDLVAAPEVYDPQFSWTPVPGAARYEVEVNPTADFVPGSKVCCAGTTIATTLSPTAVLKDNVYYWRVRAIDPDGNAGVWNNGPSFTKAFDKVPPVATASIKNVRMRDNLTDPGTDVDPGTPGYQTQVPIIGWDPVAGAASYQVEVTPFQSGQCNWTPTAGQMVKWSLTTATTAWTPLGSGWNNQKPYFDARPVANEITALHAGWSYCARVRARSDRDTSNADVYGDYTYVDDGTGVAFTWTGMPTGAACSPSCNTGYLGSGDYVLPQTGTLTTRSPLFTWKPQSGKGSYFVLVAKDASFSNIVDYAFTQLPAYAPRSLVVPTTFTDEATLYYWAVLPATQPNGDFAVGTPGLAAPQSFTKLSIPPTLLAPAAGAAVTGQPTFQWTQAEGARRYRIQVAQDPSFGQPLEDTTTDSTAYTPTQTYPADAVLYWRVRADDENLVGLGWSTTSTFQRTLPAPTPSASNPTSGDFIPTWTWNPVPGAVSYDLSVDLPDGTRKDISGVRMSALTAVKMTGTGIFHWRVRANFPKALASTVVPGPFSAPAAFTRTIGEPAGAHSELTKNHLLLSWEPKAGAKEYRVQVSASPDFSTPGEDVTTDNTAWAPLLTQPLYLDGGTLYWRAAAVDQDRNLGDFSPAQKIGLAARMRVSLTAFPVRGRRSRVSAKVVDAKNRPVGGARVTISGAGIRVHARRTNKAGVAAFRLRATKRGTLTVRALKTGYQPAVFTFRVG
jgi:hypothetical protein